jgi:hypothetical protein
MKVRFQADADLDQDIVRATLQLEPAIDFQTAVAADLPGRSVPEVLAIAAAAGRVLVSHDRKSMPLHFASFINTETSPGLLIVSRRLRIPDVVQDLILIWTASEAEEWVNCVYSLPV